MNKAVKRPGLATVACYIIMAVPLPTQAAPPFAFFNFVTPLNGSSAVLPPFFEALLFEVHSPDSDILSIDLSTGSNGITGRFVQRWMSSAGDGVYDMTTPSGTARNITASNENFDSHLLANPGTTLENVTESLGSFPTTPAAGQHFGAFPTNTLTVGYSQTGTDGFLKGKIFVEQPGVRVLNVGYVVESFFDVNYMLFSADVTTMSGTSHVFTQYIPEPSHLGILSMLSFLIGRRPANRSAAQ